MATLEQLEQALIKADTAGNVDDAKMLASEIIRMDPRRTVSQTRNLEQEQPTSAMQGGDPTASLDLTRFAAETGGAIAGARKGAEIGGRASAFIPHPLAKPIMTAGGAIIGAGIGAGTGAGAVQGARYGFGLQPNLTPEQIGRDVLRTTGYGMAGEGVARGVIGLANRAVLGPAGRLLTGSKHVQPEDLRIAKQAEDMGVILRPAEVSRSDVAAQVEQNAARSLFGKGKFQERDIKNEAAFRMNIESWADSAMNQVSKSPQELGRMVQDAIENKAMPEYQVVTRGLYKQLHQMTDGEKLVQTKRLFDIATELKSSIDPKLYPKANAIAEKIADQVSEHGYTTGMTVKKVAQGGNQLERLTVKQRSEGLPRPKNIDFMEAHDLRSLLLEINRTKEGLPKRQQAIAGNLAEVTDQAMEAAAEAFTKRTGKPLLENWRVANASVKAGHDLFDDAVIRRAIETNPEDVVRIGFAKNAVSETDKIIKALENQPQAMDAYRRSAFQDLMTKATERTGQLNGQSLYTAAYGKNGVGEEVIRRTFGSAHAQELKKFMEVANRMELSRLPGNAGNPSQTGRTLVNWFEQGMVLSVPMAALTGNLPAAATAATTTGTYIIAVSQLARLLNSPRGLKMLREGMQMSPKAEGATRVANQLLGMLTKELTGPEPPRPSPIDLPVNEPVSPVGRWQGAIPRMMQPSVTEPVLGR